MEESKNSTIYTIIAKRRSGKSTLFSSVVTTKMKDLIAFLAKRNHVEEGQILLALESAFWLLCHYQAGKYGKGDNFDKEQFGKEVQIVLNMLTNFESNVEEFMNTNN